MEFGDSDCWKVRWGLIWVQVFHVPHHNEGPAHLMLIVYRIK
jgi:hypothetical protein